MPGHSKNYSRKPYKRAKCGKSHDSKIWKKSRDNLQRAIYEKEPPRRIQRLHYVEITSSWGIKIKLYSLEFPQHMQTNTNTNQQHKYYHLTNMKIYKYYHLINIKI